jgi:hypothetical protein
MEKLFNAGDLISNDKFVNKLIDDGLMRFESVFKYLRLNEEQADFLRKFIRHREIFSYDKGVIRGRESFKNELKRLFEPNGEDTYIHFA